MTEWVHQSTLEDALDRFRSNRLVRVFLHGTVLCSSSVQGSPVHCDGVIHEQFNPHRRETRGDWALCSVRRSFLGQEELRASTERPATTWPPAPRCHRLVEINRSISVTDGQHRRDLSHYRVPPRIEHISSLLESLWKMVKQCGTLPNFGTEGLPQLLGSCDLSSAWQRRRPCNKQRGNRSKL
jgi:hypothetical protein